MKTLQRRYRQANKEAKWALLLTLAYFVWWYVSAYGFSSPTQENQELPTLYFGMPLWFLLSCVIGPIVFTLLCGVMIKVFYRDIPLDIELEQTND